jgi:hypothetical protein
MFLVDLKHFFEGIFKTNSVYVGTKRQNPIRKEVTTWSGLKLFGLKGAIKKLIDTVSTDQLY